MTNQGKIIKQTIEPTIQDIYASLAPPVSAERVITIGNLRLNIKSTFSGEKAISDSLYTIANRKIKGVVTWANIARAIFAVTALLTALTLFLQFFQ